MHGMLLCKGLPPWVVGIFSFLIKYLEVSNVLVGGFGEGSVPTKNWLVVGREPTPTFHWKSIKINSIKYNPQMILFSCI